MQTEPPYDTISYRPGWLESTGWTSVGGQVQKLEPPGTAVRGLRLWLALPEASHGAQHFHSSLYAQGDK